MTTRAYMLAALAAFLCAVTGSDLIARMTIAGDTFSHAVAGHLRWASLTIGGMLLLFIPFGGAALICGGADKWAKTRGVLTLFLVAVAALAYLYFGAFQAAAQAMLDKRWTAAALSIGLLPFFVGLPSLGVVAIAAAIIVRIDKRRTAER